MKKSAVARLIVLLLLLALLSVLLQQRFDRDGMLLNLASEFIGIGITVGYVDWILKKHEQSVWQGTAQRIEARLRNLAHTAITGVRSNLGFGPEFFNDLMGKRHDNNAISEEVKRVALHVVSPAVRHRLDTIDTIKWKHLANDLESLSRNAEQLIAQFGPRLGAKETELLLDLQQAAQSSLTFWRTFPDIAGVDDERLPPTRGDTRAMKAAWNDITAEQIKSVLHFASEIIDLCVQRTAITR